MLNKNQNGIIGDFFIATAMIVAIGFAGYMIYSANKPPVNDQENTAGIEKHVIPYPELYKQYNLPEYPDAEITNIGQENESLENGISLTAKTIDEVNKVGEFYAEAFAKLDGWKYTPPIATSETLYGAEAIKADENLVYELTITKFSGSTNIRISLVQSADSAR